MFQTRRTSEENKEEEYVKTSAIPRKPQQSHNPIFPQLYQNTPLFYLTVGVYSGHSLQPTDIFGRCNPYVSIVINDVQWQTRALSNSFDPVWNQFKVFRFWSTPQVLDFAVKDKSQGTTLFSDSVIGGVTFDCKHCFRTLLAKKHKPSFEERLYMGSEHELTIAKSKQKNRSTGRIRVFVSLQILFPYDTEERLFQQQRMLRQSQQANNKLSRKCEELTKDRDASMEALTEKCDGTQLKLNTTLQENERLKDEAKRHNDNLEQILQELKDSQESNDTLKQKCEELTKDSAASMERLTAQCDETQLKLHSALEENERLKQKGMAYQAQFLEFKDEIDRLQAERNSYKEPYMKQMVSTADMKESLKNDVVVKALRERLRDMSSQLEEMKKLAAEKEQSSPNA